MKRILKLMLYLFLSVFVVVACSSSLDAVNDGLYIDKVACINPCWYELEIEVATRNNVLEVLDGLAYIKEYTIHDESRRNQNAKTNDPITVITIYCGNNEEEYLCNRIRLDENGTLIMVSEIIYRQFDLSHIIEYIGTPTGYYINWDDSEEGPASCFLNFIWPEKNISIRGINYIDDDIVVYCLNPVQISEEELLSVPLFVVYYKSEELFNGVTDLHEIIPLSFEDVIVQP